MHNLQWFLPFILFNSFSALACSTCFGNSSGQSAIALKWSMLTLFFFIVFVLIGFAIFFIYLAKRSKKYNAQIKGAKPNERSSWFATITS